MSFKDLINTMSGGTTVQIFNDTKEIYFGKLGDALVKDFSQYFDEKVYRVNINPELMAITIAF